MPTPPRLVPLLAQYDWACERLVHRLSGPAGDSGDGEHIEIPAALIAADDAALDTVGWSDYPNGSDPEDPFLDTVWWVNQEVLHHGAEIALLRDLYGAGQL